jgi:hypothetical protein
MVKPGTNGAGSDISGLNDAVGRTTLYTRRRTHTKIER